MVANTFLSFSAFIGGLVNNAFLSLDEFLGECKCSWRLSYVVTCAHRLAKTPLRRWLCFSLVLVVFPLLDSLPELRSTGLLL